MYISSRFMIPPNAQRMYERPRLYRQLDEWIHVHCVLLRAAAGYGKSALVSDWIANANMAQRTGWLLLSPDDNDPRQFVHDLAAALDRVVPGALATVMAILGDSPESIEQAFTQLLLLFADDAAPPAPPGDQHVLLVLDDWHHIETPEVAALLLKILEEGPRRLHLMVLKRRTTGLALARLYAHNQLLVLTKDDLGFTKEEVRDYLLMQGFASPSEAELSQVMSSSEGWIMGLRLAILSLLHRGSVSELNGFLRGDSEWLAEFLTDELLNQQPGELRQFLLQTSILDAFDAPLCAAVTGSNNAFALLTQLYSADLFVVKLSGERDWYRYHPLFQELLQDRLKVEMNAPAVVGLHRRAAHWLANAGQVRAALHHLLRAGAEEEAVALVESHMRATILRSPQEARQLLDLLPPALLQRRPRLLLERCLLAAHYDDTQLMRYAQQAARALKEHGSSHPDYAALRGQLYIWFVGAHFQQRAFDAAMELAAQAEGYRQHVDLLHTGILSFLQMHLSRYKTKNEEMMRHAETALAAFRQASYISGLVALQRELGRWAMRSGQSIEATRRFRLLLDGGYHQHLPALLDLTSTYFYAAENSYWQDDLAQALLYQQAALALARQVRNELAIRLAACIGHLLEVANKEDLERGGVAKTLELNWHESKALPVQTGQSVLAYLLHDVESRLLIAAGRPEMAWEVVQWEGVDFVHMPGDYTQRSLIPYVRAYIARGVDLAAITPVLSGALAHYTAIADCFAQLHLLALSAWQELRLYGPQKAAATMQRASQLAQETGYVRVILDIPELLKALPEWEPVASSTPLPTQPAGANMGDTIALTKQEQNVLQFLAADLTYQEIADQMVISVNTVRTHVRHLYKKLSATSRHEALFEAQDQGLLEEPDQVGSPT